MTELMYVCAHVPQAGGSGGGGPLSGCTNKRSGGQLTHSAAKKQHTQQDVQPIDLCDDDSDEDDGDTPAAPAAATAPPTNHPHAAAGAPSNHQQQQQQQADVDACKPQQEQQEKGEAEQQQQGDGGMDVDGADPAPNGSLPASRAASPATQEAGAAPAPAAPAATAQQQEPATPAGALTAAAAAAAAGAAAPSAAKSTGGKAAAEVVPLTPEQRQQLLETCKQVKWASVSLGWQCSCARAKSQQCSSAKEGRPVQQPHGLTGLAWPRPPWMNSRCMENWHLYSLAQGSCTVI